MSQVNQKLITITRRDLDPGYQAVQAAHAAIEFQHEHPTVSKSWNEQSKYLIFLSVHDEQQLINYIDKFKKHDLKYTTFKEPDIGNQITAVAVEPCELSKKLCSNLPLMLKELKIS